MVRILAAALLTVSLLFNATSAAAEPPVERLALLRHGVNITNWFRFPPSQDQAALRAYLDDPAMRDLRRAGFTFVRLPVQPELLAAPGTVAALADAVARLERNGLAVVVALHPANWRLETEPTDRAALVATWHRLGPMLRGFDPAMTFPELLNEPVFAGAPGAWASLQHQVLSKVRGDLPSSTIVLTGADWGSVSGLLALVPETDSNVVYSFHLYEPAELTALGAYRSDLEQAAMARLPFPVEDPALCLTIADSTQHAPTAELMRFYCAQGWDAAKVAARIAQAGEWSRRNRVAVLAGEFGASQRLNAPARLAWLSAVRDACEQQAIGWALWGYDDSMGFALHPPGGKRQLDADVLRALGLGRPMSGK
jgi:endoglucanase